MQCVIRRRHVTATPEEKVRQWWLSRMTRQLGYPSGLIAVEKEIAATMRRVDILCYMPHRERGLIPLLLVECKAEVCSAENQVFGYNEEIQAPFVSLFLGETAQTFWKENGTLVSVPFLPCYTELVAKYG
jgi:hypothetical protein